MPHGSWPLLSCCQSAAARSTISATRVICQNYQIVVRSLFRYYSVSFYRRERVACQSGFWDSLPSQLLSCGTRLSALCWGFRFQQDLTAREKNVYSISAVHKSRMVTCTNGWIGGLTLLLVHGLSLTSAQVIAFSAAPKGRVNLGSTIN